MKRKSKVTKKDLPEVNYVEDFLASMHSSVRTPISSKEYYKLVDDYILEQRKKEGLC